MTTEEARPLTRPLVHTETDAPCVVPVSVAAEGNTPVGAKPESESLKPESVKPESAV
jgi:hypothetical protein